MGPLANFDVHMHDESVRMDAFLKPNRSFDESSGKLRLAVRFLDCPQYCEIPSRSTFTREDVQTMWYTEAEYNYMTTTNNATVRLLASGNEINTEIFCFRGLETRTMEGWENRARNKVSVKNAVFQEQYIQRSENVYNDELFSRVSQDASLAAREEALERGQLDAEEARIEESMSDERDEQFSFSYFSFLTI